MSTFRITYKDPAHDPIEVEASYRTHLKDQGIFELWQIFQAGHHKVIATISAEDVLSIVEEIK